MKYLSSKDIAEIWGVSDRRVRMLCAEGKISGAFLVGKTWNIPADAEKPKRANAKKETTKARIAKVEKLKNELDSLRPLTQGEVKRLNEEFMVDFTYHSNAIEGNTLTLSETSMVLQGVTIDQKPLKDHMEAIGHKDAFYFVLGLVKNKQKLTESVIKQIHSLVLVGEPQDKGVYRRIPVQIMGSSHTPPQPYLVPKQMEQLLLDFKKWQKNKSVIEQVAMLHLQFESTHPFIDGNGRTGRLLNNLILMQNGYPPINIKFSDRKKYYECFESYHKTNTPTEMINLICNLLEERMKEYLKILQ